MGQVKFFGFPISQIATNAIYKKKHPRPEQFATNKSNVCEEIGRDGIVTSLIKTVDAGKIRIMRQLGQFGQNNLAD